MFDPLKWLERQAEKAEQKAQENAPPEHELQADADHWVQKQLDDRLADIEAPVKHLKDRVELLEELIQEFKSHAHYKNLVPYSRLTRVPHASRRPLRLIAALDTTIIEPSFDILIEALEDSLRFLDELENA